MTVISGGLVVYEDGVKAAEEYAPAKKARVELRFDVPEDATDGEQRLDTVIELTQRKVAEMLGKAKPTAATPKVDSKKADDAKAAYAAKAADASVVEAPAEEKPKTTRRKAKDAEVTVEEVKPEPAKAADPSDMSEFDVPAADISDADLNSATIKKNAAMKDPVKIRSLIAKFNPNPEKTFTLREIAQSQRKSYLEQLEAL